MGKKERVKDPYKLTVGKTFAWSGRGVSLAVNFVILGQLTFFCTNFLQMDPMLVGTLLLASKLFDGFTDLVGGVIIDKTHTKLGKARPYEFSILGVWLFTALMFACPDIGSGGKSAWIFVTYTFVNSIFATLLNSSETVYICRAFKYDDDRVKINSYNGFIVTIACAAVSIVFPILMASMGTTREGWFPMILIFAIPFAVIGIMRFCFVPEVVTEDESTYESLKASDLGAALKSNHYIYLLFAAGLFFNMINGIGSAVGSYYFTYIVGDLGMMGLIGMLSIISPFFLLVFPLLLRKISISHLIAWSCLLGAVGNLMKGFAGANIGLLIAGNFTGLVAALPISYFGNLLVINVMDYHELKTGKRVEGIFGAIYGFSQKLGAGIASGLVGVIMGIAGFVGTAQIQSDSAIASIIALYGWVPAGMFVLIAVLMFMFKLDKQIPEIRAELESRRAKQ